jgi:hypothetical protein
VELRDLIVTPIVILLVYAIAFFVRGKVTDSLTRKYFFPALTVRIAGALALGFLYQFYYSGGDTFNFHTHGSRHIWQAFMDSPATGFKLLTSQGDYFPGSYTYVSRMLFYTDPSSYFVIRLAAIFDLLTFSSYSATAVLFSVIAFAGSWCLFVTFYRQTPQLHGWLAAATLFVPSVVFWGSGILKDTLTLACVGFLTYSISTFFLQKRIRFSGILIGLISIWALFIIKKYILLCFLPAVLLWIYAANIERLKSLVVKLLIIPLVFSILIISGYYSVLLIGADDPRYSLDKIALTAKITAYDIGFYSGRDAGSGYSLGELDGTFTNLLSKFPQAVNVSLFRPFLWEIRNPLMLMAALESLSLLILTLFVILKVRLKLFSALAEPNVLFGLIFSITFAFAVGVSTYNFGTLTRYKIPLLPFYLLSLIYIFNYTKRARKADSLEVTE